MELPAEQMLFVDDGEKNVAKACEIGLRGILIDRYGRHPGTKLHRITGLSELEAFL